MGKRIPIKRFIELCCDGGFIDYDGFGYLIKNEEDEKHVEMVIYPSMIYRGGKKDEFISNILESLCWGVEWINR